jgi:protein-L-isoaspartate O-methyltransferase
VPAWARTAAGSPEDLVQALRAEGIRDRRILAAFRAVPRARFVPPEAAGQAYLDTPVRIPHGQVTTQPSLIARMVGDGTLGVPDNAPYQAIVVSAASPRIPAPLVEQLAPGGRLVHPVGPGGREHVTAFHKEAGRLVADAELVTARFVPLVGAHGTPEARGGP